MQSVRQIAYVSAAARLMRESELMEILQTAQTNNFQFRITGMLLYAEGWFIQILEGEPQSLEKLLRKIRRDNRHHGFLILLDRVTAERDFDGSSMGLQRVSQQELHQLVGFHDWTTTTPTRRKTASALRLIEFFRQTVPQINSISG